MLEDDVVKKTLTVNNSLCVTSFIDKNVKKIVLVPKKDFIEVWDNHIFILLEENLKLKLSQATNIEESIKYKEKLEKIFAILSYGRRLVNSYDKIISLCIDIVDRYHFDYSKDGITIEKKEDHFRIWKTTKYEAYREELKKEEKEKLRKMLDRKLRSRNMLKENRMNENTN